MVGTAATRGLHRSSTSKVNWYGEGPSTPLGGAIVCDLGLFKVIGGVSNIFTKQMRLYGRNQVYRRVKVVIKVCGFVYR